MTSMLKRNVAAAVVAVAVLGGGAAALAAPGGPSRPTLVAERGAQAQGEGPAGQGRARGPLTPPLARRAVHGDLIVRGKDGEFEKVTFDRGRLASVADGSLTLERPDGVRVTVRLDDATRYRGVESAAALRTAHGVFVVSKDGTATVVTQRPERQGRGERLPVSEPAE